jgi:hypothetical protein
LARNNSNSKRFSGWKLSLQSCSDRSSWKCIGVSAKADKVSSPACGAVVSTTTFCIAVSDAFPARSVTKNFNLKLEGQESGSQVTYLVSIDDGKTWQETTVTQKDLADGMLKCPYQPKQLKSVHLLAALWYPQRLFAHWFQICNSQIIYWISKDEGKTWQETTVAQKDLADGVYQYKAQLLKCPYQPKQLKSVHLLAALWYPQRLFAHWFQKSFTGYLKMKERLGRKQQ